MQCHTHFTTMLKTSAKFQKETTFTYFLTIKIPFMPYQTFEGYFTMALSPNSSSTYSGNDVTIINSVELSANTTYYVQFLATNTALNCYRVYNSYLLKAGING